MVKKRIFISLIALLCTGAILAGVFFVVRWQQGPVNVIPVSDIYTTNDSYGWNSTGGTVMTDKVQSVFLTSEDKVLDIPVSNGQEVHAGDLLIRLDTSLSQLQVARQKLAVQKQQMALDQLNSEYKEICKLKPYTAAQISQTSATVAASEDESEEEPELAPDTETESETIETDTEPDISPLPAYDPWGEADENGIVKDHFIVSGSGMLDDPYLCLIASGISVSTQFFSSLMEDRNELYIVFCETEENSLSGCVTSAVGTYYWMPEDEAVPYFGIIHETDRVGFTLSGEAPSEEPSTEPEPTTEPGPMYTAKEIAEMKAAKSAEIRDADISLKLCEIELKRQESIQSNDGIAAEFDGIVTLTEDLDSAVADSSPVIKLAGINGGYCVKGAIGEFSRNGLYIGEEVTINSWMTGESYVGSISEISDRPGDMQGWTSGNPNVTYYSFSVRLNADASLVEGDYVDIILPSSGTSSSIYLQKPFILRENGKSYVYLERDGRLAKQEIVTGQELWGEYLEILDGLTLDDFLAFPYGKTIRDGVKTQHSTLDALYGW